MKRHLVHIALDRSRVREAMRARAIDERHRLLHVDLPPKHDASFLLLRHFPGLSLLPGFPIWSHAASWSGVHRMTVPSVTLSAVLLANPADVTSAVG